MSWRGRRRARILASLYASTRVTRIPYPEFHITCARRHVRARQFRIDAQANLLDSDALALATEGRRTSTAIYARATSVEIDLPARYRAITLIDAVGFAGHEVDLTIDAPVAKRFRFGPVRKEKSLWGSPRASAHAKGMRLPPLQRPPPPPGHEALGLEDRLRWILTPPINELLSTPDMGFPAMPRSFQVVGIGWLRDRDSALLADEMGLGKTMQAIIAARLLWHDDNINRILVICPKPLIDTWLEEIDKWWRAAHPNTHVIDQNPQRYLRLATDNMTIKIINYERLARLVDWVRAKPFSHDLIIIDEAQRIKNPDTSTARAVKALRAKRRWALTGTPLENRVGDVVSIFEFLRPGLLECDDAEYVRERIKPFFLRRRAEEVLKELPQIDDHDIPLELGHKQRRAYDHAERDGVVQLNEKGDTVTFTHVFTLIQRLMQLCNFEPVSGESAKVERIAEDLAEINDNGHKVLLFSQFTSDDFGLKRLAKQLPKECRSDTPVEIAQMHGKVPEGQRKASLKRFESDPDLNTMLLQYRVGGSGLNLQAANYVYLFDRWWNPAVEDQAVKRVHRIGQKNKVFVRRLYCKNTIEERILQKLAEKRSIIAQVIDDASLEPDRLTPETVGLTEEELFGLFKGLKARPKRLRRPSSPPKLILDQMDPDQFEVLVAKIYEADGYEVEQTGGSHDGGIDLVARDFRGECIVVQCKRWKDVVGVRPVRELWGVVSADPAVTQGHVVGINGFSREAERFADGKRLSLFGREWIEEQARKHGVAAFVEGVKR